MRKVIGAIVPAMVLVFLATGIANGGLLWCKADPIVTLNGHEVQMWIAIPEQYQSAVNGPIEFTIATPGDVDREVISTDSGFNGYGETVTFSDRGQMQGERFQTAVRAVVPRDSRLLDGANVPVELTVIFEDGSEQVFQGHAGTVNARFQMTT